MFKVPSISEISAMFKDKDIISIILVTIIIILIIIACFLYIEKNDNASRYLVASIIPFFIVSFYRGWITSQKEKNMYKKWKKEIIERKKVPEDDIFITMEAFLDRFPNGTENQYREVRKQLLNDKVLGIKPHIIGRELYYIGSLKKPNA
jgi:hypothetical protein